MIELKNIRTTSNNTGTLLRLPLETITVRWSYVSDVNRSINSKWAIFGLCHYCIQWAILSK